MSDESQNKDGGWLKLHRKLQDNPVWLSEPFTRGQAWVDLIMLANHKQGFLRIRGVRVEVPRGAVGWSKEKLAERWKWSRGKVNRFLKELETEHQIVHDTGQPLNVITLCNYEEYNGSQKGGSTQDGTRHGTSNGHQIEHQTVQEQEGNKNNKYLSSLTREEKFKFFAEAIVGLGHHERDIRTHRPVIAQITSWIDDEVSANEFEAAIDAAQEWLAQKNDLSPPPVNLIAKFLKSSREKSNPISAGKKPTNNHGDFANRDYTSDEALGKFKGKAIGGGL